MATEVIDEMSADFVVGEEEDMNEPSETVGVVEAGDPALDTGLAPAAESTTKKIRVRGHRLFVEKQAESFGPLPAENLYEYTWPLDSKDKWFLQEQVCRRPMHSTQPIAQLMEYVQVSSFKRKYPELTRRQVDSEERSMLIRQNVISETLAELGKGGRARADTHYCPNRTNCHTEHASTGSAADRLYCTSRTLSKGRRRQIQADADGPAS